MGVYIDMEMPKSCRKCMIFQPDGCGWICPIIEIKPIVDGRVNSRHPDCHLIPVPPHGRLIDADALFKQITTDEHFSVLEAMYVQSLISAAPTVIPAEPAEEGQ